MDGQRDGWTGSILAGSGVSTQNVLSPTRLRKVPRGPALPAATSPWSRHKFPVSYKYPGKQKRLFPWDLPCQRVPLGLREDLRRINSGKFTPQVTCYLGKDPVSRER